MVTHLCHRFFQILFHYLRLIPLMAEIFTTDEINGANMSTYNGWLTKDSAGLYELTENLDKGINDGSEDPKSVRLSDLLFQKHKLAIFRTCYNSVWAKYQNPLEGELFILLFLLHFLISFCGKY